MAQAEKLETRYVLGIDLGVSSVGWALVALENSHPAGIFAAGVRIFEAAAAVESDISKGQEESASVQRRVARLRRRQTKRRARRLRKLYHALERAGLLPQPKPGSDSPELAKQECLNVLDRELFQRHKQEMSDRDLAAPAHVLPYFLRARALTGKLEPFELGRALYHLGQRRGFESNRKIVDPDKKQRGQVKEGIASLRREMEASGVQTLGEFFSRLDPEKARIRGRWTARDMFKAEFELIWSSQTAYHRELLSNDLKKQLSNAIFYQRPLKVRQDLIGPCEFESNRKRAPWALLEAQRFRLLQKANDLTVLDKTTYAERPLTGEERAKLIEALEQDAELSFGKIRKLLHLRKCEFNLERGGEKRLLGNRTAARLRRIFGARWDVMSEQERKDVVEDWYSIEAPDTLLRRGMRHWGLAENQADEFSRLELQPGYCNLSRQALAKLLPLLEAGNQYSSVVQEVYGNRLGGGVVHDTLPPIKESLGPLRNPIVERTLTELRKVVNGIVREFGNPERVVIELARDAKRSKKQRQALWKSNRDRQTHRSAAASAIQGFTGREQTPRRRDIEKYLLAEECGWQCPYSGEGISMESLFGPEPQFDVEHIIPRSRSLDNSFLNKTLCAVHENRDRKRNRTPYEAYAGDPDRYEEMLDRVRHFKGNPWLVREKVRRFSLNSEQVASLLDDFTASQLNDTRYASKLAARYLGLLYGGRDAGGRRKIDVSVGVLTAMLRDAWQLNAVLNDGGEKRRDDHRHHAVDAIACALSTPALVKNLSDAAELAEREKRRRLHLPGPWPNFIDSVRETIDRIVVSHRVNHRLSGNLHEETLYSEPLRDGTVVHFRKKVSALRPPEVDHIVDQRVREKVKEKLAAVGGDPKQLESDPPLLDAADGRRIPIRKVRLNKKVRVETLGTLARRRQVISGSNHHIEIVAALAGSDSPERWNAGKVVSTLEAYRRHRTAQPVVQRHFAAGMRFEFSLMKGDSVLLETDSGRQVYVVSKFSQGASGRQEIALCPAETVARVARERKEILRLPPSQLQRYRAQKIVVDSLGRIHPAHD